MPLLEDPLAVKDAGAALRRYSLISPPASGGVSVHRLVQAVTADQMPAKLAEEWRQAAATVIEAAIPDDEAQPDMWPDFAALLPHVQAALPADSDGMERIGAYLGHIGSYGAARDRYREVVDARTRVLGPEHLNTLTARADLAFWTGLAGDPAGARDQLAALLPIRERVFGAEHIYTLSTGISLADWTGEAGDPAGARDQFAALLPVCKRVLGPEHPDTLTVRGNLARWTEAAGDAAAARDQLAALLPVRERVSGPEHPDTLTVRADLAQWTQKAGRKRPGQREN
jgi:hypothetical protein